MYSDRIILLQKNKWCSSDNNDELPSYCCNCTCCYSSYVTQIFCLSILSKNLSIQIFSIRLSTTTSENLIFNLYAINIQPRVKLLGMGLKSGRDFRCLQYNNALRNALDYFGDNPTNYTSRPRLAWPLGLLSSCGS